jgi:hypothetical protein
MAIHLLYRAMRCGNWVLFPALASAAFLFAASANAHDVYTALIDPVTKGRCCGGNDCAPLPAGAVHWAPGGVRITLTAGQAKAINKYTSLPVDAFVAAERLLPSPDGSWHACIHHSDRQAPREGILCALAPPSI